MGRGSEEEEAPAEGKWICLTWPVNYHLKPFAERLFIFKGRGRKKKMRQSKALNEINKGKMALSVMILMQAHTVSKASCLGPRK